MLEISKKTDLKVLTVLNVLTDLTIFTALKILTNLKFLYPFHRFIVKHSLNPDAFNQLNTYLTK